MASIYSNILQFTTRLPQRTVSARICGHDHQKRNVINHENGDTSYLKYSGDICGWCPRCIEKMSLTCSFCGRSMFIGEDAFIRGEEYLDWCGDNTPTYWDGSKQGFGSRSLLNCASHCGGNFVTSYRATLVAPDNLSSDGSEPQMIVVPESWESNSRRAWQQTMRNRI